MHIYIYGFYRSSIYLVDIFCKFLYGDIQYPLVNVYITMGNHNFKYLLETSTN